MVGEAISIKEKESVSHKPAKYLREIQNINEEYKET